MRRWVGVSEDLKNAEECGVPYGSRTRVAAVKGRCPRPLDERDAGGEFEVWVPSELTYRTSLRVSNLLEKLLNLRSHSIQNREG